MPREPDRIGPHGKAWLSRVKGEAPAAAAFLGGWIIERPGAHPFWTRWVASVVHLRPIEGVPPAQLRYPQAEFELLTMAIDPRGDQDPDAGLWTSLHPPELVFQFHGVSDRDAMRLLEKYVASIVDGGASPDSDFRSWWERTLAQLAGEFRAGKHPEN